MQPLSSPPAAAPVLSANAKDVEVLKAGEPMAWMNERWRPARDVLPQLAFGCADVEAAGASWDMFRSALANLFPTEVPPTGIVDSDLVAIADHPAAIGRLLVKCDHALPIGASIKARGGVFEVLEHARDVATINGVDLEASRTEVATIGQAFGRRKIVVGSTGNLAFSVARMALALGFEAEVHISADATPFKKERLKAIGATLAERSGDYAEAVECARRSAMRDPLAYLVDDERSERLFLGYSHGATQLAHQLEERGITVDAEHPLAVYLPCGVGGAPGGLTFGLKAILGDAVACVFVEPTQSPCFMVQLMAGRENPMSVYDIGLTNHTIADGLAVPAASMFVARMVEGLVDACVTVAEQDMLNWTAWLQAKGLPIEPSAAAAFGAIAPFVNACRTSSSSRLAAFASPKATHVAWSTGRSTPDTARLLQERLVEATDHS